MQKLSIEQIKQELGEWEEGISLSAHSLNLVLEQSSNHLEWYVPHPDKEFLLFARPSGFQLSSQLPYNKQGDYALLYKDLEKIELLPSVTRQHRSGISIKLVLISIIAFVMLGALLFIRPIVLVWIIFGLQFGLIMSLYLKKRYRQNLLMVYNVNGQRIELLFSIFMADKEECISFFEQYTTAQFIHEGQKTR